MNAPGTLTVKARNLRTPQRQQGVGQHVYTHRAGGERDTGVGQVVHGGPAFV
jgi:hypothetical protein